MHEPISKNHINCGGHKVIGSKEVIHIEIESSQTKKK